MTAPMNNKAWVATGFQGPASLKLETSQLPSPGPNQIVVKSKFYLV
jgi:D-arabinose 1-dehydrogenase-like Zn-dependent alcohol dehydrogenase